MVFDIDDVAGITFQLSRLPNFVLAYRCFHGHFRCSESFQASQIPIQYPPREVNPPTMGHLHQMYQMSAVKYIHHCVICEKFSSVVQKYSSPQRVAQSLVINLQCTYVPEG